MQLENITFEKEQTQKSKIILHLSMESEDLQKKLPSHKSQKQLQYMIHKFFPYCIFYTSEKFNQPKLF